jgi:hypothetical protein
MCALDPCRACALQSPVSPEPLPDACTRIYRQKVDRQLKAAALVGCFNKSERAGQSGGVVVSEHAPFVVRVHIVQVHHQKA